MHDETWILDTLRALDAAGLRRTLVSQSGVGGRLLQGGREILNFSSNDYLALARHPEVTAGSIRAVREWGNGATASRLVAGTLDLHGMLERELAEFKRYPAALLFGSGYMANVGLLSALAGPDCDVLVDRLAHASVMDGARLSGARFRRFRHNDVEHLERLLAKRAGSGLCVVVTESVFSMDGDLAPLAELARVCAGVDALLVVDEAHATGVFGECGAGRVSEEGLEAGVAVSMGTLSKGLGGYGGFVACSEAMRELLVNRSRAFIYSTAPPPAVAGAALAALSIVRGSPGLGAGLLALAREFRDRLRGAGLDTGESESQIVPVMVGDSARAVSLSARLRERGVLGVAIRPPTVPEGTARIRLSVTLAHGEADIERAADVVVSAAREEGIL